MPRTGHWDITTFREGAKKLRVARELERTEEILWCCEKQVKKILTGVG